jgi:hypothetical protein
MLNRSKFLVLTALVAGGASLWQGCLGGFERGLFRAGWVDNWWLDVFTDWINEDLFG